MRLAKYLASCGIASRRHCEEIIRSGVVKVDGSTVNEVSKNVLGSEVIEVNEEEVIPQKLVYYLLNKPTGYTSSVSDLHAKKLVTELVPEEPPVWPVGRLDRETSGLIIMTNDGDFTNNLIHPKYKKEKEYEITTNKPLSAKEIIAIKNGLDLKDGQFKPDAFYEISSCQYKIIIHEGRNRLIRRAIEQVDKEVVSLKRIRIDNLTLNDLKEGQYRLLTKKELEGLKNV